MKSARNIRQVVSVVESPVQATCRPFATGLRVVHTRHCAVVTNKQETGIKCAQAVAAAAAFSLSATVFQNMQ